MTETIHLLTPNDHYSGRTAPLTSKRFILYIYSINIGTEYFKHGIYSPFFSLSSKCSLFHNSNVFGSCIIHILYTGCAKIQKNNSGAKRLMSAHRRAVDLTSILLRIGRSRSEASAQRPTTLTSRCDCTQNFQRNTGTVNI